MKNILKITVNKNDVVFITLYKELEFSLKPIEEHISYGKNKTDNILKEISNNNIIDVVKFEML